MSFPLPERFRQMVAGVHGEHGEEWLKQLPQLLEAAQRKWSLRLQEAAYPLSYHFIAPAILGSGEEAVIKLGPRFDEMTAEIAALRCYDGRGAVKLIEYDKELGMVLLERLRPGKTLAALSSDEEAVRVAASVMGRLWRTVPQEQHFQTVAGWFEGYARLRSRFQGGTGPLPERLVELAEQRYARLAADPRELHLLHGDLHHENILSADREPWLAIDPKGVIGEREYEAIPFLMNYVPEERGLQVTARRVDMFAEHLQLDRERLLLWAYCHAVLSAWWHIEDATGGEQASVRAAERFDTLIRS